jgi:hypothetical protein
MNWSIQEDIAARNVFFQAFGRTMSEWGRLESCLFYWFLVATEIPDDLARAVFFSAKAFTGRRGISWRARKRALRSRCPSQ